MEPRALLYRRIALWMPVLGLVIEALIFAMLSRVQGLFHAMFGGIPLPTLTNIVCFAGPWFFLVPLAASIIAIVFTIKKPSQDLTLCLLSIFVSVGLLSAGLFVLGLCAPLLYMISHSRG